MSISMDIPGEFLGLVDLGKVIVRGTILKDAKTGKIVGHLRESKNLIDMVSRIPANPVEMVSGLVQCASSIAANYQLHEQGIKIDFLVDQVKKLAGLAEFTAKVSSVGAIASLATFALCASKFKAIDERLNTIETKVDEIIDRLESLKKDNDKREIRGYLAEIKSSFDYLLPNASQTRIENIQGNLSKGFSGINGYLKDKIYDVPEQLDFNDVIFLYDVLIITAMGEFRGFVILNDIQGAKHILQLRKADLSDLKKSFSHISKSIRLDSDLKNYQLLEKTNQFEELVNNVTACYADFDSQRVIVSEYIDKKGLSLKNYYEEIESDNNSNGIIVVPH